MNLIHTNFDNCDFQILVHELDMTLNAAANGHINRSQYDIYNTTESLDHVILLYAENNTCAGCGAYRKVDDRTIELKRIYVRTEYRRNHYGEFIIYELISTAASAGVHRVILETGELLPASIRLYEKIGFYVIPNYPPYQDMKESLCMEKILNDAVHIRYRTDKSFTRGELVSLFDSVGWISKNYPERLEQAINHSSTVISAWDGDTLIGLVNAIDDTSLTSYIHYLLVNPAYHKLGIGKTLLKHMRHHYKNYLYLLLMAESKDVIGFYEKLGFTVNEATPLNIFTP